MARYTKTSLGSNYASKQQIDSNLDDIKTAIDDTLSRKGDSPNSMEADLDMNSNRVLNLPDAESNGEPLTLGQFNTANVLSGSIAAANVTYNGVTVSSHLNNKEVATTAEMTALSDVVVGDVIRTKERSTGNGGGGTYDVISGTGTANTYNIIAHDSESKSFVLRIEDSVKVSQFGSTAAALQAAIDHSLANNYKNIVIDSIFDTTGTTLLIDKGLIYTEGSNAFARKRLTFKGMGSAEIRKSDTGSMFSATSGRNGDIAFENITFSGDVDTAFPTIVSGLNCFDCDKLIRVNTTNCTFRNFDYVWYQDGTVASPMQSVKSTDDTYTKNNVILRFNNSWDIVFNGGLMEDGVQFLTCKDVNSTTRNLIVNNGCTIEGMTGTAIQLNCVNYGTKIINSYFEANTNHIQMNRYNYGVSISNNSFLGRGNVPAGNTIKCIDVSVGDFPITVDGNVSTETTANTTLISIDTGSAFNVNGRNLIGQNDVISPTVLTDVSSRYIDLVDLGAGLQNRWVDWNPTLVWTTATPTGVSTVASYKKIGTTVFIKVKITATDGNGATGMTMTLPFTPKTNNRFLYVPAYQAIGAGISTRYVYVRDNGIDDYLTWVYMGTATGGQTYDTRFELSYEVE